MSSSNVSSDLIWEIARTQNSYLVKRKQAGGVQFSRDPFNLTNKHSRKQSGFVNEKAVSVQSDGDKAITLKTKKSKGVNKPASSNNKHTYSSGTSNRKVYKAIADAVGKHSYRGDLTQDAVARASALRLSSKPKKDTPPAKPRGAAAKKAAA